MTYQFKNLSFLLVIMLLLIILLEAYYGLWFNNDDWKIAIRKGNLLIDIKNTNKSKDSDDVIHYTRDNWGIRKTCDDITKTNIITLGGSTTDERHIDDYETYSSKLQDLINKKEPGTACIANAGLDGHRLSGNFFSVKEWLPLIPNIHAKYYILYIGLNEAPLNSTLIRDGNSLLDTIKLKSAFYYRLQILVDIINQIYFKQAYIGHEEIQFSDNLYSEQNFSDGIEDLIRINTEIFESNLNKILYEIANKGAKAICISQPHRMSAIISGKKLGIKKAFYHKGKWYNGLDFDASLNSINMAIQRNCISPKSTYIDLNSEKFENSDFYNYVHTTKSGSDKIARLIYEKTQPFIDLSTSQ